MRRTLLAITAVLLATVGTTLLYVYVKSADDRARLSIDTVKVLVAKQDTPAGTAAGSLQVEVKEIPRFGAPAQVLSSLTPVAGQVLKVDVFAQEQLMAPMFATRTTSGLAPKRHAVSVLIPEARRVPALLKAGSIVDIYLARDGKLGKAPLLTGIKVIDINNGGVITFDVTQDDGEKLLAASLAGDLMLMLSS